MGRFHYVAQPVDEEGKPQPGIEVPYTAEEEAEADEREAAYLETQKPENLAREELRQLDDKLPRWAEDNAKGKFYKGSEADTIYQRKLELRKIIEDAK